MNLSPRQVELVRSTFASLEPKARIAALAYYQRLFTITPALRSRLPPDIDLESDKLMALLRTAADFADRPRMLQSFLTTQGQGCASYDAGGEHHAAAGEALLWSLATTLGREFTPEARAAWAELHAAMGAMRCGGESHGRPRP